MAGSRTLKLSILGDVDNLNKSLKTASGDVDSFGDKVGKAGVAIGKAFAAAAAAAGAAAIAIGIEGVKAAIADEKAQTQLALALENATGATQAQIKATEDSILQMSLATGVADDELRPALGRLVRSTGDITKAQDLLSTALDISAATGKPVEAIANSLAKAYDGNTAALGKLGVGLSTAELKTMSFEQVQGRLTELFGGAAARNADTYAGQIARVQVAFDEAKETLGTALLPILDQLLKFINENALPAIQAFSAAFSLTEGDGFGKVITDVGTTLKKTFTPIIEGVKSVFNSVKTAVMNSKDEFKAFWDVVKFIAPLVGKAIGDSLKVVGDIAELVITIIAKVLGAIKPLLNTAIDGINAIIKGYNAVQWGKDVPYIPKIGGGSGSTTTGALGNFSMSTGATMTTTGITSVPSGVATGGTTSGATSSTGIATAARVAAAASNNIVSGSFDPGRFRMAENAGMGTTINLTVTGAFDREGTARTIVETLNDSFYRGTGGANSLQIA
jgi:phage-related protein